MGSGITTRLDRIEHWVIYHGTKAFCNSYDYKINRFTLSVICERKFPTMNIVLFHNVHFIATEINIE